MRYRGQYETFSFVENISDSMANIIGHSLILDVDYMKTKAIRLQCRVQPDTVDYKAVEWYSDATKLIQELYGDNWQLFVDLLAATSPRQSVKRNWRQSAAILAAYIDRENRPKRFGDLLGDVMRSHLNNVVRALQQRPINGPKVSRFAANLKGDLDVVTIDTWICKAYAIEHKALTTSLYNRLEQKIRADGERQGIAAANWQAVIWYTVRRLAGKRVKSFVSVYQSIFCETPYFAFMADSK